MRSRPVARRMRATLVLVALLAAGCLEDNAPPQGDDLGPSVTPPASPSPTPAPSSPSPTPTNATLREVAVGSSSGHHEPYRRVIAWEHGWDEFWTTHVRDRSPPDPQPTVDFTQERLIAVVLGDKANSCWAVRVTDFRVEAGEAVATITTFTPPPDMMCASVITQPFHVVGVPLGPEVRFVEEARAGPPPS